jgi:hypothetical protein
MPAAFSPALRGLAATCAVLLCGCSLFSAQPKPASVEDLPPPAPVIRTRNIDPKAEEFFVRAHVLWKGGEVCSDPAMAVLLLDQALAVEPAFADALMYRGLAYSEIAEHETNAVADTTEAIRLDPTPERYAYRGLALVRQDRLNAARRDLDQSIRMRKGQHRAWNIRGAINVLENNIDQACDDFETACDNGNCSGMNAAREAGICR